MLLREEAETVNSIKIDYDIEYYYHNYNETQRSRASRVHFTVRLHLREWAAGQGCLCSDEDIMLLESPIQER